MSGTIHIHLPWRPRHVAKARDSSSSEIAATLSRLREDLALNRRKLNNAEAAAKPDQQAITAYKNSIAKVEREIARLQGLAPRDATYTQTAYKGYLITNSIFNPAEFYIKKNNHNIGTAASLEAAKKIIDQIATGDAHKSKGSPCGCSDCMKKARDADMPKAQQLAILNRALVHHRSKLRSSNVAERVEAEAEIRRVQGEIAHLNQTARDAAPKEKEFLTEREARDFADKLEKRKEVVEIKISKRGSAHVVAWKERGTADANSDIENVKRAITSSKSAAELKTAWEMARGANVDHDAALRNFMMNKRRALGVSGTEDVSWEELFDKAPAKDAARLVTTEQTGDAQVKVYWVVEDREYICKLFVRGVYQSNADYFTDDRGDALRTAIEMARRASTVADSAAPATALPLSIPAWKVACQREYPRATFNGNGSYGTAVTALHEGAQVGFWQKGSGTVTKKVTQDAPDWNAWTDKMKRAGATKFEREVMGDGKEWIVAYSAANKMLGKFKL